MLALPDPILWLPVVSVGLGTLLHSLNADGAASILEPYTKARLPASVLPILILLISLGSGVIDAHITGADWQHAAAVTLLSLLGGGYGAVRNHTVLNPKLPPQTELAKRITLREPFASITPKTPYADPDDTGPNA